jgi:hypothetical protein
MIQKQLSAPRLSERRRGEKDRRRITRRDRRQNAEVPTQRETTSCPGDISQAMNQNQSR